MKPINKFLIVLYSGISIFLGTILFSPNDLKVQDLNLIALFAISSGCTICLIVEELKQK